MLRAGAHIVVTGGSGFLGSHLCEQVLTRGHQVTCLDNFVTGAPENIAHLLSHPNFTSVHCDLSGYVYVPGPVDLILHFASPASPIDYLRLPIETLKVGAIGTWNALGLAKEKRARLVLASTSEIYGDPQVHPQPESYWGHVNPIGPRGVYDEAKRYAEALVTAYRKYEDVDTAVVRIFNTYGPRMRPDDGRAIPTFIRQALDGVPLTVAGDGSQTRSLCHVADTVDGVLRLAFSDDPGPINIGNPDERSVLKIAQDVVAATCSASTIEFVDRPMNDPEMRCPDISLAKARLGWSPRISWSDGLASTVDAFRQVLCRSAGPETGCVR